MRQYDVFEDYYLQEQGIQIEVGMQIYDGDLEPDVIATLLSLGVIVDPDVVQINDDPGFGIDSLDFDIVDDELDSGIEKPKRQSGKR